MKTKTHKFFTPDKEDLEGWIHVLRTGEFDASLEELLYIHNELHRVFGDAPNDVLLPYEQRMSQRMRALGVEHRHIDALSEAAGTTISPDKQAAPTLEELTLYITPVLLEQQAVVLKQGVEMLEPVVAQLSPTIPESLHGALQRRFQKMMPPGVQLSFDPAELKDDFIREQACCSLMLAKDWSPVAVAPNKKVVTDAPAMLQKSNLVAHVRHTTVLKHEDDTRFILGPVLIPEEEDAQGDVYSHEEVEKACHWWAENSMTLTHKHVLQGGREVEKNEMKMVENYILPADVVINGEKLKAGTWMLGAKVYATDLIKSIDDGDIKAWSIGAEATVEYE